MSDWTKVEKEKGTDTKIDKGSVEAGWFTSGWFFNWFGKFWVEAIKVIGDFTKVTKATADDTKVVKTEGDWTKITKE